MIPLDRLDCQCPRCKPIGQDGPREILLYNVEGKRPDHEILWPELLRSVPTEEWPRA